MQFRVPQNVMMEDKIVGPLTALQFLIMVIGGGLAFSMLNSKLAPPINQIVGGLIAVFTVTFAMGKFNGQPLYSFIRYFIAYLSTPKTRIWHKAGRDIPLIRNDKPSNAGSTTLHGVHASRNDIAELARVLDSRGHKGIVPHKTDKPKS